MSVWVDNLVDELQNEIVRVDKTLTRANRDCLYFKQCLEDSEKDRDNAMQYLSYLKSSLEKIRELESNLYG